MFEEIEVLQRSISEVAIGFDARALSPARAEELVVVLGRMEASVAAIKALVAARQAEGDGWRAEGYRSAADQLAHQCGMSPGSARRALDTGKRLSGQPEVAIAALAGHLSIEQAAAVSDGAEVNPARTADLLSKAGEASLPELAEAVARAKAEVTDLEARRRAVHARRSLRRWADSDGGYHIRFYGHPEDGAAFWQVIDPIRRRLIMARRQAGGLSEALEAHDYDAAMTLVHVAAGRDAELDLDDLRELGLFPQTQAESRPVQEKLPDLADPPGQYRRRRGAKKLAGRPAKVIVRVDLDTLLRGYPAAGETCELDGYGPVPVSAIERLVASGNAFLAAVVTGYHKVIGVYHHGRRPTTYQQTALEFLFPECAVKGCRSRDIQWDHRSDWAKTGYTLVSGMDGLCGHHHRLKTEQSWALTPGSGKRDFVAVTDPRHPQHPLHATVGAVP